MWDLIKTFIGVMLFMLFGIMVGHYIDPFIKPKVELLSNQDLAGKINRALRCTKETESTSAFSFDVTSINITSRYDGRSPFPNIQEYFNSPEDRGFGGAMKINVLKGGQSGLAEVTFRGTERLIGNERKLTSVEIRSEKLPSDMKIPDSCLN